MGLLQTKSVTELEDLHLGLGKKAVLNNRSNCTNLHYHHTLSLQISSMSSTFWSLQGSHYTHSQDEENKSDIFVTREEGHVCVCAHAHARTCMCMCMRKIKVTLLDNYILMKWENLQLWLMLLKMKNAEKWKMFWILWAFNVAAIPFPLTYDWITIVWWAILS